MSRGKNIALLSRKRMRGENRSEKKRFRKETTETAGGLKRTTEVLGPNEPLIGGTRSRAKLATPALVLDLDALEFNIRHMAEQLKRAKLSIRPHAKTHKSINIARMQMQAGAIGICVATLREASVMVHAGLAGVLLTSPIVGAAKTEAFAALLDQRQDLMIAVDNIAHVSELAACLRRRGQTAGVLIDIDLGMNRTGVHNIEDVVALVRAIAASHVLRWEGIQAYAGLVQHIPRRVERKRVYGKQLRHLRAILAGLAAEGLHPKIVSGGGTGTFEIDLEADVFTEVQCGSYVFMDVEYDAVELCIGRNNPFKTALFVQCSVVSHRGPGLVAVDGGTKSFSSDGPSPRVAIGAPGSATFRFFGDEFGTVGFSPQGRQLELGTKIELATPHCDPTVNLHSYYHCCRGSRLLAIWPVDARGPL